MPQNGQTEISDNNIKKFLRFGNVDAANYGFTLTQYWFRNNHASELSKHI